MKKREVTLVIKGDSLRKIDNKIEKIKTFVKDENIDLEYRF
jgi:hypothetical protein